jgi:DNA damage-inducible protein 1
MHEGKTLVNFQTLD